MSENRTFPTVDEMKAAMRTAYETIAALEFHPAGYTIQDYPIGGSSRGLCRLAAEGAKGKGWRTVRTTTNKRGQWCKPKKSVYFSGLCCVVTGPAVEREAAWLRVEPTAIYLQSASGENTILARWESMFAPRREPERYTITVNGVAKEKELPADPAEKCDAYDVWMQARRDIVKLVAERMTAAEQVEQSQAVA